MHDVTKMPKRPMWPDIRNAAGGLNPYTDQHRVRKHYETEHMAIGARYPMGGNDGMHLGERSLLYVNPRMTEERLFRYAGEKYPANVQEGWKKTYANYTDFFNSRYYKRILEWLKPGIADGHATPTFGPVPYVQHIRPHGGVAHRESYGYFDALEAAELGQPWLVDGYYQNIRHYRNQGIDHIVHLGRPDRNEEWQWRSDEAKQRVIDMADYGKGVLILDNAAEVDQHSASYEIIERQLKKGLGAGIEGTPRRDNTAWNDLPCPVLSWSHTSHRRHIQGIGGNHVVMGKDSEFGDLYGRQEWIISFGFSHFNAYGLGKGPTWDQTEKVEQYLAGVAAKTHEFFAAHDAKPNQGELVCLLDHRIINLAAHAGKTPSFFGGD